MKKIETCIVIVNFNGKSFLKDCLDSIKKNTISEDYKVILVDNDSSDGSQEFVKKNYPKIDLIENEKNLGFAEGNNIGIKYGMEKYEPDYFYLLNNDTKVARSWLEECIKIAKKKKEIGIVGSKQYDFEGKKAISAAWIHLFGVRYYWENIPKNVGWVSGACFLVKKDVFEKIGFLDKIYSPAYYEETDFEKRALKKGYEIWHCPTSIVYHKGGCTTQKLENVFRFKLLYRNRLIFFVRHYGIFYFFPRMVYDIWKAIKTKRLKLLFASYREGLRKLK